MPSNDLLSSLVAGAEREAAALVEDLIGLTTDYIDVVRDVFEGQISKRSHFNVGHEE